MNTKLAIIVMGHRNSGKSRTWNDLFGETVRTGKHSRPLYLAPEEYVDVFLISGSPEERGEYVGDLITDESPSIILCSMQYTRGAVSTLDYFTQNGYLMYIHWLNPGYSDKSNEMGYDQAGLIPYLHALKATVAIRDGKGATISRIQELREYLYGWASYRNLLRKGKRV